jgi:hypothetical protein
MAEFNQQRNKLTFKLVYYGPAQSGKTTNLMRLHDLLASDNTGEFMSLETRHDRTLFFDLLPVGFHAPTGLLLQFKLFTVPGQVQHDSTRKAVLSRADAVVFVADSQVSQQINNAESFQNLLDNIARVGLNLSHLPLVVQFNKRDLGAILSETEIRDRWYGHGQNNHWPLIFSCALDGYGVMDTFRHLLQSLYRNCANRYALQSEHGLDEAAFLNAIMASDHKAAS